MNPNGESRLDRMERMIEAMRARRAAHEERCRNLDDAPAPAPFESAWARRLTLIAEKVLASQEGRRDEGTNGHN